MEKGIKNRLFPFLFLAILIFNTTTTWWVWNASPFGVIMANLLNSLFLSTVIWLAHFTRTKLGNFKGDIALVFYWIAWEYFHLDWDLSWTWLNLGNGLANATSLVQWYEYTGVFGGTLWILVSNLFFTHWVEKSIGNRAFFKLPQLLFGIRWILILVIPIVISLSILSRFSEAIDPQNVVIVQPNIDPYNEKFNGLSSIEQVQKMLDFAKTKTTKETDFVVFPETAIPQAFDEDVFESTGEFALISEFCSQFPETQVIIGASTFVVFGPNEKVSATARATENGIRYDVCNTAISMTSANNPQFYHKSKLVPGVEKMPFPAFFSHFQSLAFDLGGTVGSLAGQDTRTVFESPKKVLSGPIICYESVYGEFVGEYVLEGAELLVIITNDGWWGNTPGYKQHAAYGQLRAIEHRRSIARSANTGISCVINQKGETTHATEWWTEAVISAPINKNTELTFYSKYGDVLGRISLAFGGLLLIWATSKSLIAPSQK